MVSRPSLFRALVVLLGSLPLTSWGQAADPVLFTVEDDTVRRQEFEYIYRKSYNQQPPYTRASLEEYLDLYLRFKVKVRRARELGLDTLPALGRELAGYRQNLADSYLVDRQRLEDLTREAYERQRQDVDISHVLIGVSPLAAPSDTLAAYRKALEAREKILSGTSFAEVARSLSDDPSAAANGGRIGYVTALFPNGYYPLETAAYRQDTGILSVPIRTTAGYHILRVHARRPARGEIDIAHIMLSTEGRDSARVRSRIESIHALLQDGADFDVLARRVSEDASTRGNAGRIGPVGINRFETPFEDAAFALRTDGAISPPVRSSVGWHIIRRIRKPDIQPFATARYPLENEIREDRRFAQARHGIVRRVRTDYGFTAHLPDDATVYDTVSAALFTPDWRLRPEGEAPEKWFTLGDSSVYARDFADYLAANPSLRLSLPAGSDPAVALQHLVDQFVETLCLNYLDARLEARYPDFRYLMREYREGILLFEATQQEVWRSAGQDSAGLLRFFEDHRNDYRWKERARLSQYYLRASAGEILPEVRAFAATHGPEATREAFNEGQSRLAVEEQVVERGAADDPFPDSPWEAGILSPTDTLNPNATLTFFKLEEVLPPADKTLEEARGYVMADYQDFRERAWVDQLLKKYEVHIHEDTLRDMVVE